LERAAEDRESGRSGVLLVVASYTIQVGSVKVIKVGEQRELAFRALERVFMAIFDRQIAVGADQFDPVQGLKIIFHLTHLFSVV
jgi:hypothetical protein